MWASIALGVDFILCCGGRGEKKNRKPPKNNPQKSKKTPGKSAGVGRSCADEFPVVLGSWASFWRRSQGFKQFWFLVGIWGKSPPGSLRREEPGKGLENAGNGGKRQESPKVAVRGRGGSAQVPAPRCPPRTAPRGRRLGTGQIPAEPPENPIPRLFFGGGGKLQVGVARGFPAAGRRCRAGIHRLQQPPPSLLRPAPPSPAAFRGCFVSCEGTGLFPNTFGAAGGARSGQTMGFRRHNSRLAPVVIYANYSLSDRNIINAAAERMEKCFSRQCSPRLSGFRLVPRSSFHL